MFKTVNYFQDGSVSFFRVGAFDFSGKKSIYVLIIKVKRALSIVLVVVFLFNVIGYYGIYVAMLSQARTALNEKIDNDQYKEDQTVTIKIPLTLPYPML